VATPEGSELSVVVPMSGSGEIVICPPERVAALVGSGVAPPTAGGGGGDGGAVSAHLVSLAEGEEEEEGEEEGGGDLSFASLGQGESLDGMEEEGKEEEEDGGGGGGSGVGASPQAAVRRVPLFQPSPGILDPPELVAFAAHAAATSGEAVNVTGCQGSDYPSNRPEGVRGARGQSPSPPPPTSLVAVPFHSASDGQLLGVCVVCHKRGRCAPHASHAFFSSDDGVVLGGLLRMGSLAIENAKLRRERIEVSAQLGECTAGGSSSVAGRGTLA
jgi:hypothetical protein